MGGFEKLSIAIEGESDMQVDCAARDGDFAVTRHPLGYDRWKLTHVPSGFGMGWEFTTIETARAAMLAINSELDMSAMIDACLRHGAASTETVKRLKEILREHGGLPEEQLPPDPKEKRARLAELRRRMGWVD